jgi:hypothetical protein
VVLRLSVEAVILHAQNLRRGGEAPSRMIAERENNEERMEMKIPGFTAEVSLYQRNRSYRIIRNPSRVGEIDPKMNPVRPSTTCVTYDDWFDFWLETALLHELIFRRSHPIS